MLYFATAGTLIVGQDFARGTNFVGTGSAFTRSEQTGAWLIAVLAMLPSYRKILTAIRSYKPFIVMLALALASVFWSPVPADSLRRVTLLGLTIAFGYFLVAKYSPEDQMRLMFAIGRIAVLLGLLLIFAAPYYGQTDTGEWRGIFGSHADSGMFLCFLLSPYPFLKIIGTFNRLSSLIIVLLGFLEIFMTQSRGGWLLAAVLIGYWLVVVLLRKFPAIEALSIVNMLLILGGGLAWLLYENFASFTYLIGKDPSLTHRTLIWRAVRIAIGKRPILGYGYGGFWNGFEGESANVILSIGVNITHAHDGYLNIWLQLGVLGLGLFISILVLAFKDAFKGFFIRRASVASWYFGILLLTIVGSVDESFLMKYDALTTILLVVACVGLRQAARSEIAA